MVSSIQIEPLGGVVPPLTVGEQFCWAIDRQDWDAAEALLPHLNDKDKQLLVKVLRARLREDGCVITEKEDPYPNPGWYVFFPRVGEQYTRLFLQAIPDLIAWSQECSLRKQLLGIDCLFTAVHRQDYETARLIVSLDPKAALRKEMGETVALHHVVWAPKLTEQDAFDEMANRAICIAALIYHTAIGAVKIPSGNGNTPLGRAYEILKVETNAERRAVYNKIIDVLKNPPLKLLALGLSAARVEGTPCPLQRFVFSDIFEPHVLRIILRFLTLN